MDCSPPSSSVHGILQAGILERVAIPFSRVSSRPRDRTLELLLCSQDSLPSEPPGKPQISEGMEKDEAGVGVEGRSAD